jgi:LysR family transcriptional regulator, glycine cleavage system transcriptional activator
MATIENRQRTRPIAMGYLRAFQAVARHLNFRLAADELALTQSAVSRQIQALEDEIGVPLFLRHTRAVELTSAGGDLLAAVVPALERLDGTVRQIRQNAGRRHVAITTWASFASMWLIPRLEDFQDQHPDIDIRIDTSDATIDLDTSDTDLALRYTLASRVPPHAVRMFGEQLAPVASPWLLKDGNTVRSAADLARFTLIEAGDIHRNRNFEILAWQRWFDTHQQGRLQPKRWLYFDYAYQMVQAAIAGQGLVLARMPLVSDSLASGDLVELLPGMRIDSPLAYWRIVGSRAGSRAEVAAFCAWLDVQAAATRAAIGEEAGAPPAAPALMRKRRAAPKFSRTPSGGLAKPGLGALTPARPRRSR